MSFQDVLHYGLMLIAGAVSLGIALVVLVFMTATARGIWRKW